MAREFAWSWSHLFERFSTAKQVADRLISLIGKGNRDIVILTDHIGNWIYRHSQLRAAMIDKRRHREQVERTASMSDRLHSLPPEVVLIILSYLPIDSLIAFGATSRSNHAYHIMSFTHLHLAIFNNRIHSLVAFLEGTPVPFTQIEMKPHSCMNFPRPHHYIPMVLPVDTPSEPPKHKSKKRKPNSKPVEVITEEAYRRTANQTVRAQNAILADLLSRYGGSLTTLEFMAYDLDEYGAHALGSNCQNKLRNLALRYEHTHVNDPMMRKSAWKKPAPPSTAWNPLIGIGVDEKCGLKGLETLTFERAGITPWQLRKLVKRNRGLRELKLRTCSGVQPEFLTWLGTDGKRRNNTTEFGDDEPKEHGSMLETLWVENCMGVSSRNAHVVEVEGESVAASLGELEWVSGLRSMKVSRSYICFEVPEECYSPAGGYLPQKTNLSSAVLILPRMQERRSRSC